jgi:hypothetical protein
VQLWIDGTLRTTGTLAAGSYTFAVDGLGDGGHSIEARHPSDPTCAASSATTSHLVGATAAGTTDPPTTDPPTTVPATTGSTVPPGGSVPTTPAVDDRALPVSDPIGPGAPSESRVAGTNLTRTRVAVGAGTLARTGIDTERWIVAAVLLLVDGVLLIVCSRRLRVTRI